MERADLERLDRTNLIAQAEALGVARANILTRPELVDELLVRSARKDDRDLPRARGFFGRARDLVARVIEKGLHLPDAAERLRQVSATATQIAARVAPTAVPTVTLAEIYAAQGHRARAVETLRRVLELEPDHGAAQALLSKLETAPLTIPPRVPPPPPEMEEEGESVDRGAVERGVIAAPSNGKADENGAPHPHAPAAHAVQKAAAAASSAPPGEVLILEKARPVRASNPHEEPVGFLDDAPLPERYDVDECVALAIDPVTVYVYWEVRDSTLDHVRRTRGEGGITLRLLLVTPSWDGPRSATRDFEVDAALGDRVVRDLPAGAVVRAAIGFLTEGIFLPIAHAPSLETPPGEPSPARADVFVRWTPRGLAPVTAKDADYASIRRALEHLAPRREDVATYERRRLALGSSELSAGFGPSGAAQNDDLAGALPSSESMI